jgi:hypothetical protein
MRWVAAFPCFKMHRFSRNRREVQWLVPEYVIYFIIIFLWRCYTTRVMASSFLMFLDHTRRRTTVGRTPLDEFSARRRDLYLTTHSQQTNIHAACGIRTHDPCRQAAADLPPRPRGHWDLQYLSYTGVNLWLHRKMGSTITVPFAAHHISALTSLNGTSLIIMEKNCYSRVH